MFQHVGELSQQLLNGQYHPEAVNCFEIDKADGKKRLICAAAVRDKLVQRAILSVIKPLWALPTLLVPIKQKKLVNTAKLF